MSISEKEIDKYLDQIGDSLSLPKSSVDKVEQRYNSINDAIKESEFFKNFEVKVYAQGSYRIGTTLKPYKSEDFDLDYVFELNYADTNLDIVNLLKELNFLFESSRYNNLVEIKNRCVRINYSDGFHVDIIPGKLKSLDSIDTTILIPDKERKTWLESNPNGFALWYFAKSKTQRFIYKSDGILNGEYEVEELPESISFQSKPVLSKSVILLKRLRDVYFNSNLKKKPPSILLTTLAGHFYNKEENAYSSILNILNQIQKVLLNQTIRQYTCNPTCKPNDEKKKEDFAEKWDKDNELFALFSGFIDDTKRNLTKLPFSVTQEDLINELHRLFEKKVKAIEKVTIYKNSSPPWKEEDQSIKKLNSFVRKNYLSDEDRKYIFGNSKFSLQKEEYKNENYFLSFRIEFIPVYEGEDSEMQINPCEYELKLLFPNDYPNNWVTVYEVSKKIHKYHINKDDSLCLGSNAGIHLASNGDYALKNFIEKCVCPFLANYEYHKKFKKSFTQELSHGSQGIFESYSNIFSTTSAREILLILHFLQEENYRGHLLCFCGSEKRLRNCHGKKIPDFFNISRTRLESDISLIEKYIYQKGLPK